MNIFTMEQLNKIGSEIDDLYEKRALTVQFSKEWDVLTREINYAHRVYAMVNDNLEEV